MATPVALMVPPIAANPAPTPVSAIEAPFAKVTLLAVPFARTAWPPPVVHAEVIVGNEDGAASGLQRVAVQALHGDHSGSGPAAASHTSVPPVTLVAGVMRVVEMIVLPTTVVTPEVTVTVVVLVGGLGPMVCDRAGQTKMAVRIIPVRAGRMGSVAEKTCRVGRRCMASPLLLSQFIRYLHRSNCISLRHDAPRRGQYPAAFKTSPGHPQPHLAVVGCGVGVGADLIADTSSVPRFDARNHASSFAQSMTPMTSRRSHQLTRTRPFLCRRSRRRRTGSGRKHWHKASSSNSPGR